jgi:hypothetical protein
MQQLRTLVRVLRKVNAKSISYNLEIKRKFLSCRFDELSKLPKEIDSYESLYKYSIEKSDEFWSVVARSRLSWFKEFTQTSNSSGFADPDNVDVKWFIDGKLNVSGEWLQCHV